MIRNKYGFKNIEHFGPNMMAALAYARKSKGVDVRCYQTKDGWVVTEWI